MTKDSENIDSEKIIEFESVEDLNQMDTALIEYTKKTILESGETIKNFSQAMITLSVGLFTVYFALLKFLGLVDPSDKLVNVEYSYLFPPLLLIISLIFYIIAILPLRISTDLYNLTDMKRDRDKVLALKFIFVIIGASLLLISLGIAMWIFLQYL